MNPLNLKSNGHKKNIVILAFCLILFAIFYIKFTHDYMVYFNVGLNRFARMTYLIFSMTPWVIITQIVSVAVFDRFVSRNKGKWRSLLNISVMLLSGIIFFTVFELIFPSQEVPREGGFIRFLGYYFFGLAPGRIPDGSW